MAENGETASSSSSSSSSASTSGGRLPARSTRGNRMTALIEADDFWSNQNWEDEEDDEEYESEAEEEDVVDEDFDQPEEVPGEEEEDEEKQALKEEKETAAAKTRGKAYSDPRLKAKKAEGQKRTRKDEKQEDGAATAQVDKEAGGEGDEEEEQEPQPKRKKRLTKEELREQRGKDLRASTRTLTVQDRAERERQRQMEEEKKARRKRVERTPTDWKVPTQEEILEEAKITEEINLASLDQILKYEEDQKKKNRTIAKPQVVGPRIQLRSKEGVTQITFPEGHLPSVFNPQPTPYPKPLVCAVTGKPAKYIDPLTKKPYAGIEEFKTLRKEHAA